MATLSECLVAVGLTGFRAKTSKPDLKPTVYAEVIDGNRLSLQTQQKLESLLYGDTPEDNEEEFYLAYDRSLNFD